MMLPEISERYKALKNRPGSVIEISPESHTYAAEFARRIGGSSPSGSQTSGLKETPSGAALIIDYGTSDTIPTSTLRGIMSHKLVSPLSSPGRVDVSADVDFTALAEAALDASENVEVHGPMEQGLWLENMGIRQRADMLSKGAGEDGEKVKKAVERLVERGGGGMGRLYKVMAIVPESGGKRPVGFGGQIDG